MRARSIRCAAVTAAWLLLLSAAASGQSEARLGMAQQLLDQGNAAEALAILDQVLKQDKRNAQALLMRSTGRIMAGNLAGGFKDLQRALEADPGLRQGWLNLAGLEIAEGRFDTAYDALVKAEKLDPSALDNHLNLGAVLVMQGRLDEAAGHFERYLAAQPTSAEARYLVASNYALSGHEKLAIEHLAGAIALDERLRLRARTDERFLGLASLDYKVLLNTDVYTPPPDHHQAAAAFRVAYRQSDNKLLYTVLDALKQLGEPYEPQVEANPRWALIWGAMRIKITNQSDGNGVVQLSAPADRFTADEWARRSQDLFRAIHERLGG